MRGLRRSRRRPRRLGRSARRWRISRSCPVPGRGRARDRRAARRRRDGSTGLAPQARCDACRRPPQSRVHYELSDARAFAGTRAVVVGLGDVAMETAIALALQPGTTVTMVHRGSGFSRGRLRNVETVGRLVAEGRIGLLFGATVRSIEAERLVVEIETTNAQHSLRRAVRAHRRRSSGEHPDHVKAPSARRSRCVARDVFYPRAVHANSLPSAHARKR